MFSAKKEKTLKKNSEMQNFDKFKKKIVVEGLKQTFKKNNKNIQLANEIQCIKQPLFVFSVFSWILLLHFSQPNLFCLRFF